MQVPETTSAEAFARYVGGQCLQACRGEAWRDLQTWIVTRPSSVAALQPPRTLQLNRLDENIGAVAIELTPDDLREIDGAASKITVQGARYPEKLEKMTGR